MMIILFKQIESVNWADWLSAIGTISATGAAVYFGLMGNKETKILTAKTINQLDYDSFEFLTDIPWMITHPNLDVKARFGTQDITIKAFISNFHRKIIDNSFINSRELKRYLSYVVLAENYAKTIEPTYKAQERRQALFNNIKENVEKLSNKIDLQTRTNGKRKLTKFESYSFWDKNIFQVNSDPFFSPKLPSFLVYFPLNKETELRSLLSEYASSINVELAENYLDEEKTYCIPLDTDKYDLINKQDKKIIIEIKGKEITLQENVPYKLPNNWLTS